MAYRTKISRHSPRFIDYHGVNDPDSTKGDNLIVAANKIRKEKGISFDDAMKIVKGN